MVGDLVLRLKQDDHGKLESPWVGPRRILSTTIQEDKERTIENTSYDPPHPEHEATGRVPWVNSTKYICYYFPLGGSDPRVV
jgi:hypothetical protein